MGETLGAPSPGPHPETPLQRIPLAIDGLSLIRPARSGDERGQFSHFYRARDYEALGLPGLFVEEHASRYALRHTVRGLHFQAPPHAQHKLVRVSRGRIHDVVVDVRPGSPSWGRHVALELAQGDWTQLVVPPGFAHGFCTLEPDTEVVFRLTDYNDRTLLAGLRWNDPALGIEWPCGDAPAYVYPFDTALPALAELRSPF